MAIPPIQHHFVNWRDGMKITQMHLTQHDMAVRDAIRDVGALSTTPYNYGLLPRDDGKSAGLQLSVLNDTIELYACRALTPGGIRIEWENPPHGEGVSLSLMDYRSQMGSSGIYYIVLRASFSQLIETGQYDADEQPMRKPFTQIKPALDLVSSYENLSDAYSFPIFRVKLEGQVITPDYEYIPPSTGVFGESLLWYYESCGKSLNTIHQTAVSIIRKINGMQQQSPIAKDVWYLADKLVAQGLDIIENYRLISIHRPPVFFVEQLCRYARTLKTTIDSMSEHGAARLYQYIRNNIGGTNRMNLQVREITKSFIDSLTDSVLANPYSHNDCTLLLDNLKTFLDFLEFMLQSLLTLPYVDSTKWDIA